jgi:signal transduction histidine kinase
MDELFPSVADYFYLSFYPLMLLGLLSFPVAPLKPTERLKYALDLATVMIAAWIVVWYFVVGPTAAGGESDWLTVAIAAAYPIGDLVVMGGTVALLLRRQREAERSALLLFLGGLAFYVAADLIYGYASIAGTYVSGGWVDIGWVAAYLVFAYAAIRQPYAGRSQTTQWSEQFVSRLSTLLPIAAIVVGYGLAFIISALGLAPPEQIQGLLVGVALLTLAIVGRLVVTLRENARLNAELRVFSNELEARVEQRTHQLQQSQEALLASQKLASVGTLASGVVHEVSNPLSTILTAVESLETQLAANKADPETLKVYLPIISRAAWHATRIVQALRTYSRGSAPELAAQNVTEVVQDALLLMGYQLKKWSDIKLETELDADLPDVICDRNQIAQALINLLSNAKDAMPQGGTISLRTRRGPQGVVIEVADQGMGIAPENVSKIFDPFFTTKPIGEGSGLGLSIVSGILRAHNGTIEVHSDGLGRGTAFTLTLPVAPAR